MDQLKLHSHNLKIGAQDPHRNISEREKNEILHVKFWSIMNQTFEKASINLRH